MMKIILLISYCLLPIALIAQNDNALKYASTITVQDLNKHLSIIAGADMEGRETATEGQRKAATYIESQFKHIGLKYPSQLKGFQQTYPLFKDTLLNANLRINKKKYEVGKDFILIPGSSFKQNIKSPEIVFIGYGIDDTNHNGRL